MKAEKETLVLGVGNLLLKDEGVGIHVIKALENEKLPAHVHLMDGGTCLLYTSPSPRDRG